MKVKCVAKDLTEEQKKILRVPPNIDPGCGTLTIGKDYLVLGITYEISLYYWTSVVFEIEDDIGSSSSAPICLFEIVDPRPSVFWRAQHFFPNFTLWPVEFYQDFFHDLLSDGEPEINKIFDSVVNRLTYEFEDATQGLPDPLAWPFEEYK